jgi:TetR/AcrR family transcriptional repressor of lmrAB and yxaGH operons
MAVDTRQKMIVGAARLLARRGLQETSFSEVLELTGAPRGSIYHHFPEGKDQLVAAAIDLAGTHAITLLDQAEGSTAEAVTTHFLWMWRQVLTRSSLTSGCSVLAVTVATDSVDLLEHAAEVFRSWRLRLAELLEAGGLASTEAGGVAALLIAASEGAVVLSRAEQSMDPFDRVDEELTRYVQMLARTGSPSRGDA